jgi:hypothetical protein
MPAQKSNRAMTGLRRLLSIIVVFAALGIPMVQPSYALSIDPIFIEVASICPQLEVEDFPGAKLGSVQKDVEERIQSSLRNAGLRSVVSSPPCPAEPSWTRTDLRFNVTHLRDQARPEQIIVAVSALGTKAPKEHPTDFPIRIFFCSQQDSRELQDCIASQVSRYFDEIFLPTLAKFDRSKK